MMDWLHTIKGCEVMAVTEQSGRRSMEGVEQEEGTSLHLDPQEWGIIRLTP